MKRYLGILIVLTGVLSGLGAEEIPFRYARGVTARREGAAVFVTLSSPWPGASSSVSYVLVPRGKAVPAKWNQFQTIRTPVRSFVSLSTSYLPCLKELGEIDSLSGVDTASYASLPEVRRGVKTGSLREIGSGPDIDIESLVVMNPDLIMTMATGSEWDSHPKMAAAGLPVVFNGDWMESHPLGRAEWIRFIALFYGKLNEADRIFGRIEEKYKTLAESAALRFSGAGETDSRPKVLVNLPYEGQWIVPGGRSYTARLIRDAGGRYLWEEDRSEGSLFLDFEGVFARSTQAEFWLWHLPGRADRSKALGTDSRIAAMPLYRSGRIYNNDRRITSSGGNDFYEAGALHPELILEDLIRIFSKDVDPKHFYREIGE